MPPEKLHIGMQATVIVSASEWRRATEGVPVVVGSLARLIILPDDASEALWSQALGRIKPPEAANVAASDRHSPT